MSASEVKSCYPSLTEKVDNGFGWHATKFADIDFDVRCTFQDDQLDKVILMSNRGATTANGMTKLFHGEVIKELLRTIGKPLSEKESLWQGDHSNIEVNHIAIRIPNGNRVSIIYTERVN